MASSVYYKFKSAREESRVTFDGTGISVFDLKKAIVLATASGKASDFDLQLFDATNNGVSRSPVSHLTRCGLMLVHSPQNMRTILRLFLGPPQSLQNACLPLNLGRVKQPFTLLLQPLQQPLLDHLIVKHPRVLPTGPGQALVLCLVVSMGRTTDLNRPPLKLL